MEIGEARKRPDPGGPVSASHPPEVSVEGPERGHRGLRVVLGRLLGLVRCLLLTPLARYALSRHDVSSAYSALSFHFLSSLLYEALPEYPLDCCPGRVLGRAPSLVVLRVLEARRL